MEQYSNLNVHGKITQKAAQGTNDDDVVKYKTLEERVPSAIPEATAAGEGMALIVENTAGNGETPVYEYVFGEAGKVDDVKIGTTSLVSNNKIATIPAATSSAKGVVQTGTGITNSSGTISVTYGNTAGTACEGNDSRLSNARTPTSHTHGNLTNDGKLGTTANKPVVTTTGGTITAGSVTSPIAMSGTSITHETSGVSSSTLSKGSASKSVSVTVNQWGHVTSLSDQNIVIAKSQVTDLTTDLSTITGNISTINGKIPSAASTSNQLADKAFVNSSIGTATSNFLGTYNAVSLGNTQATVDAWSGSGDTNAQTLVAGQIASHLPSGTTVTKNDYVFVAVDQTPTGDAGEDWFWRFKYTGSTWAYEYTLNNSSFTADQWTTINSLVTNTSSPKVGVDVKNINAHLANSTIHVTSSDKSTWNGKQNAITGAATTITSSNLTASRVLISNSSGKVAASSITTTELEYLDNVTEDIQTQLDTKFDTISQSATGDYVSSISVDSNDPSTLTVTRATLPTLSGGAAASSGKYVSGVTVSGHAVTVTQANLPTLSGGAAASNGKYVSGVTVSGHAVTVTQANLPSLSKGTTSGTGNVVSDISVSGHTITLTKDVTALTSHQTIKQDGITGATINRYGACSTAAATAAKTVSITSGTFPTLDANANGTRISVNFTNANTAGTPTLNVNSKGAKNIYYRGAQVTTATNGASLAGVCDFIYDNSTGWHLVGNNSVAATDVTLADM